MKSGKRTFNQTHTSLLLDNITLFFYISEKTHKWTHDRSEPLIGRGFPFGLILFLRNQSQNKTNRFEVCQDHSVSYAPRHELVDCSLEDEASFGAERCQVIMADYYGRDSYDVSMLKS